MREFVDINKIYPKGRIETDNYIIDRWSLNDITIDHINKSNTIASLYVDKFEKGKEHLLLVRKHEGTMMSDHPSETITNQDFIDKAKGDVLVFGLGLGLIIFPLLNSPDIKSITIVEMDPHLPKVVGGIISPHDLHKKVKIEVGDAFTYFEKMNDERYDTIYFDIWAKIDDNSFSDMDKLHSLYKKYLRSNGYLNSWCYDHKGKI